MYLWFMVINSDCGLSTTLLTIEDELYNRIIWALEVKLAEP